MRDVSHAVVLLPRKRLEDRPSLMPVPGIAVRTFQANDVAQWLALRRAAFADEKPAVRDWSADEFRAEMLAKPWWRSEWTWLAAPQSDSNHFIGAVTLAERAGSEKRVPVVHWLMVEPAWRRRGVGRLLMFHLEQTAWDGGGREIELETHAGWKAAVALYRELGYNAY